MAVLAAREGGIHVMLVDKSAEKSAFKLIPGMWLIGNRLAIYAPRRHLYVVDFRVCSKNQLQYGS